MSSESRGGGIESSSKRDEGTTSTQGESSSAGSPAQQQQEQQPSTSLHVPLEQTASSSQRQGRPKDEGEEEQDRKPAADEQAASRAAAAASQEAAEERPRQVIAVSANRGPTAFFNLARRFLITDEMCDLSALEGAIVSAVDAAHLLERSKLATIVRVQTSYVTVEPKRKKRVTPPVEAASGTDQPPPSASVASVAHAPSASEAARPQQGRPPSRGGRGSPSTSGRRGERELKRARIVITVRRTANYTQWLEENPLQAVIAGDAGTEEEQQQQRPGDTKESHSKTKPS